MLLVDKNNKRINIDKRIPPMSAKAIRRKYGSGKITLEDLIKNELKDRSIHAYNLVKNLYQLTELSALLEYIALYGDTRTHKLIINMYNARLTLEEITCRT